MNNKANIEEDIKIVQDYLEQQDRKFVSEHRLMFLHSIENILADRERLIKENKKNTDTLEILNKMKKKYKIALFMVIRNSTVLPKGIELQKSSKEISQMSYETMCEVLTMIDFNTAQKMYEEGKTK